MTTIQRFGMAGTFLMAAAIAFLSNTPHLLVSDPSTWLNSPSYRPLSAVPLAIADGSFFSPYGSAVFDHEFWLRKAAHVLFYAMLGVCLFLSLGNRRSRVPLALALVFVYAFADELHQSLVAGRHGMFADVLIDSAGAALALMAVYKAESRAYVSSSI